MLTAHGYIQGYNGQALVDSKHLSTDGVIWSLGDT
jgi:hypothetical protein